MALIPCPECRKRIATTVDSCPRCRHKLTPEQIGAGIRKNKATIGIAIACVLAPIFIVLIFMAQSGDPLKKSIRETPTAEQLRKSVAEHRKEYYTDSTPSTATEQKQNPESQTFGIGDYIEDVIAAWGKPDYTERGLEFNPDKRWLNYAGYRYRGFVFVYLDHGQIIKVDKKEPAVAPEDADVRPKPKHKTDVLTSMKPELIDGYGLRLVKSDGATIDIKFRDHRDTVRAEFGFPDNRQVVDGPNYLPSETTIHETYYTIGVTFIYGFADKRVREFNILSQ